MWESRVLQRAFERLELHEGKLSRAVLRGGGGGDVTSLPDTWVGNHPGLPGPGYPNEVNQFGYVLGFPQPGLWLEVLNGDIYDNGGNPNPVGNGGSIHADGPPAHGLPCSAAIVIPANGFLVFARNPGD